MSKLTPKVSKESWTVYIVRCSDDSLYTGITKNVDWRISDHNRGRGARYTSGRRPVTLVYQEPADDISSALKREVALKKLSKSTKEKMVKQYADASNDPTH